MNYTGRVENKLSKGEMLYGKPVGLWKYYKLGNVSQESNYSTNGFLDGVTKVYHENGVLHYQTEYSDGWGRKSTYFDLDGKIEKVYINY